LCQSHPIPSRQGRKGGGPWTTIEQSNENDGGVVFGLIHIYISLARAEGGIPKTAAFSSTPTFFSRTPDDDLNTKLNSFLTEVFT